MELGDRIFWGVIFFIGVILIWLGVLEKFIPLWVGVIVGIFVFLAFLMYGLRPIEEKERE